MEICLQDGDLFRWRFIYKMEIYIWNGDDLRHNYKEFCFLLQRHIHETLSLEKYSHVNYHNCLQSLDIYIWWAISQFLSQAHRHFLFLV